MNLLERAVKSIFKVNLAVKRNEKVLIIVDRNKSKLGKVFLKAGERFVDNIDLIKIPVPKVNGEEPPKSVALRMLNYDVVLLVTTRSLSHTKARKNACKKGARIVSLPNVTAPMLKRALNVDYSKMHKRIKKISDVLDKGKIVRVLSKKGTDLVFSIKARKAHGRSSGIFTRKGAFGNLPDGESFIAPVEGSAEGVFIIDGVRKEGDKPTKVFVERGYATIIKGGKGAKKLLKLVNKVGKKARNIAEFGIGANDKAKIIGNMLEDEKAMETCHIALGDNSCFGGKVEVPLHIDGLIKKPTVFVDGEKVVEEGKILSKKIKSI